MAQVSPLRKFATTGFHHVSQSVADLNAVQRCYQYALGLTDVIERFRLPEPAVRPDQPSRLSVAVQPEGQRE